MWEYSFERNDKARDQDRLQESVKISDWIAEHASQHAFCRTVCRLLRIRQQYMHLLTKVNKLQECASRLPELRYVIDEGWSKRVKSAISAYCANGQFEDGAMELLSILTDDGLSIRGSITPEDLDRRLRSIEQIACEQKKKRDYKKTRGELRSKQNNQILGALFEIVILSDLVEEAPGKVKLYPRIGGTGRNVEAKVDVSGRRVYVEAKAIGHSKFDPQESIGSGSIPSMEQQVQQALDSKLGEGAQVSLVADSAPTVLCLALGFHASHIPASWVIDDFLTSDTSNVSCVFMAESGVYHIGMKPFPNDGSIMPLTDDECSFFESVFRTEDYYSYRGDKARN